MVPIPFNQQRDLHTNEPYRRRNGQLWIIRCSDTKRKQSDHRTVSNSTTGVTPIFVCLTFGYSVNSVTYQAAGNSAYDALQGACRARTAWGLRFGASIKLCSALDEESGRLGFVYTGSNPLNLQSG